MNKYGDFNSSMRLREYLIESLLLEAGYDTSFDTADEYVNYFRGAYKKFNEQDEEFIRFVVDEVWDGDPDTVPFRIDKSKTNIKLYKPYRDSEKLVNWLTQRGITDIMGSSIKPGSITFTWGSGSLSANKEGSGSIPTDTQEMITCMIFNEYLKHQSDLSIEDLKTKDWNPYNKYFTEKSYKTWLKSWVAQVETIFRAIPKSNDLIAVHYDDKSDRVAETLRDIHEVIRRKRGLRMKDAFDPTDIIIYSKSKSSSIVNSMKECAELEDGEAIVKAMRTTITELYHNGSYVGVSLKKGTSFRPHFMNFEPAVGFENAHFTGKISIDPVYGFFGGDEDGIEEFMKMKSVDKYYYKEIVKKYGNKRNKSCVVIIDCDDEKNIKLNIRTNSSTYHNMLVLEPSLYKAHAQMGKVPVDKWESLLAESNPTINNIKSTTRYDIEDIIEKFEYVKTQFNTIRTTPEQLRHLFELFGDKEKEFHMDNEIWACYIEIHILYAILTAKDTSNVLRNLLLWAEKLGDDCLPYLLIMPTAN